MSWSQLLAIKRDQARQIKWEERQEPRECPNDGTQLEERDGVLHCPFDGWRWRR